MTTVAQSPQTSRQMLLRAQEIRELIRDARGAFVPDYVARALRDRYMEPLEEDAEEVAELLGDLVDISRQRIEENGIEPLYDDKIGPPKLPKRERESVANLAMLMATRSAALLFAGRRDEALEAGLESVAWGRTSRDYETQALAWMGMYAIYERMGRWDDQRSAMMQALDDARASEIPKIIVETMLPLISYLIEAVDLEKAERLNQEVQSLLQSDFSEEDRHPHYAVSLAHAARISRYRGHQAESLRGFREALRWADGTLFPLTRCSILSHLGACYTQLEQHRQCIECQSELVELADMTGVEKVKSWAYINLAEAHQRLEEYEQAMELLDHAERYAAAASWDHITWIIVRRAEVLLAGRNYEEAAVLCRQIIETTDSVPRATRLYSALFMLGQIEEQCLRYESAEDFYRRAVAIAAKEFPQQIPTAQVGLARVLYTLKRSDEARGMLEPLRLTENNSSSVLSQGLRLLAAIAEEVGDLRTVIDCERRAVAIERELLERKAEQALHNARVMLETDLLEREAELERERRRQIERDLANAVVALGDHARQAAAVEQRLRQVLAQSTSNSERAVTAALHEALLSLRKGKGSQKTVHHYMAKVDEDFQRRLRQHYPDLTRKQERLCGLIRAGLDSKEIASLLDLQPEGLKALRKRLRKQLGLGQDENLESFLADI